MPTPGRQRRAQWLTDRDLAALAWSHGTGLAPSSDELRFRNGDGSGVEHTLWGVGAPGVAEQRAGTAARAGAVRPPAGG